MIFAYFNFTVVLCGTEDFNEDWGFFEWKYNEILNLLFAAPNFIE